MVFTSYVGSISIHALREEGDYFLATSRSSRSRISIHALREEGDQGIAFIRKAKVNFYPRPPRGGRLGHPQQIHSICLISIHALREEGDHIRWRRCSRRNISIHALREEGDHQTEKDLSAPRDFYPRPPRGGRHNYESCGTPNCRFLSTPSARRAT